MSSGSIKLDKWVTNRAINRRLNWIFKQGRFHNPPDLVNPDLFIILNVFYKFVKIDSQRC